MTEILDGKAVAKTINEQTNKWEKQDTDMSNGILTPEV